SPNVVRISFEADFGDDDGAGGISDQRLAVGGGKHDFAVVEISKARKDALKVGDPHLVEGLAVLITRVQVVGVIGQGLIQVSLNGGFLHAVPLTDALADHLVVLLFLLLFFLFFIWRGHRLGGFGFGHRFRVGGGVFVFGRFGQGEFFGDAGDIALFGVN